MQVRKVLVVGAGIGGLGAAAALARLGVDVDVVDIRPDSHVLGVGINQPGNSLRALDDLGVLDEILAVGFAYGGNHFRDWNENSIVDVPSILGDDRVPANNALTRSNLHRILKTAAEQHGARIRYGTTVADLVDDGAGVDVTLNDGTTARYDAVAAFDGVHSAMRSRLFGDAIAPQFSGFGVWRVQLPRPAEIDRCNVYQGPQRKAGLIPLSREHMYMFLVTAEPGNPHYDPATFDTLLATKLEGFGGIIGRIRDGLAGNTGIVYSPLIEIMKPLPWHSGRVMVLGDAVHAAAPHLTQGAGMALEDAVVLADELTTDREVEQSLAAAGARRHDRAKLVFDVSHAILEAEMQITEEMLPFAVAEMREALPGQTAYFEGQLNLPFRSPSHSDV